MTHLKTPLSCCAVVFLFSIPVRSQAPPPPPCNPCSPPEPISLYDDFGQKFIDPAKWATLQSCKDTSSSSLECVVEIEKGQLRLVDRVYAATNSNDGGQFSGSFLHISPNPAAVRVLKADVTINDFETSGCVGNPAPGSAAARITGSFFNTATPTPGSILNDVYASINVARLSNSVDSARALRVTAHAEVCLDSGCSTISSLGSFDLGTIRTGEKVSLELRWEPASTGNHRFLFTLTENGHSNTAMLNYGVSDTALSGANVKDLFVGNSVPNCTSPPRPATFTEAFFDNVFVNSSAVP